MKIRDIKYMVDSFLEKFPQAIPEKTLIGFLRPVECEDVESEMTVELGHGPDRYHEDTWHDVTVPIYFDIEDWDARHNIASIVNGIMEIDPSWNNETRYLSLKDFMKQIDAHEDEDQDVVWKHGNHVSKDIRSGTLFDSKSNHRGLTFAGAPGKEHFDYMCLFGTDEIDENPDEWTIRQYVESHEDHLSEQAYERAEDYERGLRDWDDYDEDDYWED